MRLLFLISASHIIVGSIAATLPLTRRCACHTPSNTASLLAAQYGTTFDVDVTFGNQIFQLLVDTGSSDTYVMRSGFTCINATTNLEIPEADCLYSAKTYDQSCTYRQIQNETFGVQYGNGIASGVMAYEDITLAGITVEGQAVGIADQSNPMGDGVNSGVLGLGYPSLTSAHPGNHADNKTFFYNRTTPLNLSTSTFGGYLTLGDLPPVPHVPYFSVVPVEILDNIPAKFTSGQRSRSYWAFTVSAVTYGEPHAENTTTNTTAFQAFTDTGNEFSFLPAAVVEPINALFSPPAMYDNALRVYVVAAMQKRPPTGDGTCVSLLASSETVAYEGVMLNILGVSFLKNVVSVYDFGRNELRFAQRLD
ncbi:pepsin-like aspartic protease [Aspergillus homomorphus CBS 101889]|uniref:Acid protease n=1 Tax=Aspergillus homomorphus (strain CBS 101889) TaxID=1450537 RepID=A0A395HVB0_ASPHC|nr:acid protease [Aspergillus homomorphus CBS 101889]RAL10164.1 acid protease [Aspergillus homomorphus CBS 101889]